MKYFVENGLVKRVIIRLDTGDMLLESIEQVIKEAGIKEVTVIDNGEGIAAEDVPLAFFRHATSKIKDRQDLFQVNTLGFRGEALPSIASVADVCLETALQTETQGTFYHVRGGEVTAHKPAAMRQGTKITVTDLFYNTPARLKYLSSTSDRLAADPVISSIAWL